LSPSGTPDPVPQAGDVVTVTLPDGTKKSGEITSTKNTYVYDWDVSDQFNPFWNPTSVTSALGIQCGVSGVDISDPGVEVTITRFNGSSNRPPDAVLKLDQTEYKNNNRYRGKPVCTARFLTGQIFG